MNPTTSGNQSAALSVPSDDQEKCNPNRTGGKIKKTRTDQRMNPYGRTYQTRKSLQERESHQTMIKESANLYANAQEELKEMVNTMTQDPYILRNVYTLRVQLESCVHDNNFQRFNELVSQSIQNKLLLSYRDFCHMKMQHFERDVRFLLPLILFSNLYLMTDEHSNITSLSKNPSAFIAEPIQKYQEEGLPETAFMGRYDKGLMRRMLAYVHFQKALLSTPDKQQPQLFVPLGRESFTSSSLTVPERETVNSALNTLHSVLEHMTDNRFDEAKKCAGEYPTEAMNAIIDRGSEVERQKVFNTIVEQLSSAAGGAFDISSILSSLDDTTN